MEEAILVEVPCYIDDQDQAETDTINGKKRKLDDEEEDIELEIEKKRKVVSKKIVQALGGIEQLKGVCSGQFSTLQFKNPKRPLGSHPLHADVLPCNALLLTVNVNNSSTENDQDDSKPSFTTNISALMTSSCRFRGLADFQYLPNESPLTVLRDDILNLNIEKIKEFKPSEGLESIEFSPGPPIFSRNLFPTPFDWNPVTEKKVEEVLKFPTKKKIFIELEFHVNEIPTTPPQIVESYSSLLPEATVERFKKLFDEKPIWSRVAIQNAMDPEDVVHLARLLPLFGYTFSNGPWRRLWIKYGYDPRLNNESRIYQTISKRLSHKERNAVNVNGQEGTQKKSAPSHILSLQTKPENVNKTYQLCDIHFESLQEIITSLSHVDTKCTESEGWFKKESMKQIRNLLTNYVNQALKGEFISKQTDEEKKVEEKTQSKTVELEKEKDKNVNININNSNIEKDDKENKEESESSSGESESEEETFEEQSTSQKGGPSRKGKMKEKMTEFSPFVRDRLADLMKQFNQATNKGEGEEGEEFELLEEESDIE